ncbi:MAG: hypothetical protein ACTFAL_04205 [Candidatus Electronema sp. V4]|uniref:hypothetical protein n=1 Tax=Candidatus Electronema sp. V4 TaxID=3454756 RepID=UPI0040556982
MSRRKHTAPEQQHDKREPSGPVFTVQLGLSGIGGIGVVLFCLFLWMFLLGIWAGQILYPPPLPTASAPAAAASGTAETRRSAEISSNAAPELRPLPDIEGVLLLPSERKRRISPPEPAGIRAE